MTSFLSRLSFYSIKARLAFGFFTLLMAFSLILGLNSWVHFDRQNHMSSTFLLTYDKNSLTLQMRSKVLESSLAIRDMALQTDISHLETHKKKFKFFFTQYLQLKSTLSSTSLTADEKAIIQDLDRMSQQLEQHIQKAFTQISSFDTEGALLTISRDIDPLDQQLSARLQSLAQLEKKISDETQQHLAAQNKKDLFYALFFSTILMVACLVFSLLIIQSIRNPLTLLLTASKRVASGNLSVPMVIHGRDEFSELMQTMETMRGNLLSLIQSIQSSSLQLDQSVSKLVQDSTQTSNISVQQHQSANSIAQSFQQLAHFATALSHSATQVDQLSQEAGQLADQGRASASHAGQEMTLLVQDIEKTATQVETLSNLSDQISTVAATIRTIAEQTNLLALNAAIEAARAGDQGRGFAVVADEVRKLAEKTEIATREIAEMLHLARENSSQAQKSMTLSVQRAQKGLTLTHQTEQTIAKQAQAAQNVALQIQTMAHDLDQQNQTSQTISIDIQSISQMTHDTQQSIQSTQAHVQTVATLVSDLTQNATRFTSHS